MPDCFSSSASAACPQQRGGYPTFVPSIDAWHVPTWLALFSVRQYMTRLLRAALYLDATWGLQRLQLVLTEKLRFDWVCSYCFFLEVRISASISTSYHTDQLISGMRLYASCPSILGHPITQRFHTIRGLRVRWNGWAKSWSLLANQYCRSCSFRQLHVIKIFLFL